MKQRLIFVVWNQISRRSAELSKRIGAEYINLGRVDRPTLKRLFNLVVNFFRTYSLFRDRKPEVIFTFHAHPLITLSAAIYKKFNRCQVVADLHSAAYLDHYRFPLKSLNRWVWKKADILLIHNRMSQNYFNQNIPGYSGKLFVLEDPIPAVPVHIREKNLYGVKGKFVGILVSRFSDDEPVLPFLEQTKGANNIYIYVTGNYTKARITPDQAEGENYRLTGFLDDDKYWELLAGADFIIALTTREYTLLSAGYEALALEKPLLISDTDTLREYFQENVEYLDRLTGDIGKSMENIIVNLDDYQRKMFQLKQVKNAEWDTKITGLINKIV